MCGKTRQILSKVAIAWYRWRVDQAVGTVVSEITSEFIFTAFEWCWEQRLVGLIQGECSRDDWYSLGVDPPGRYVIIERAGIISQRIKPLGRAFRCVDLLKGLVVPLGAWIC